MQIVLSPPAPYDFARTVAATRFLYTAARAMPDGALRRLVRIDGQKALLELRCIGDVDQPRIAIYVLKSERPIDPASLWTKAHLLLNARANLAEFYDAHAGNPLEATTSRLRGLHAFGADTLFEAIALTMIEQQITLKMAQNSERWLMSWTGSCMDYEGEPYFTFPSAEQIANTTLEDLLPMKITGVRISRIIALAQAIVENPSAFESSRHLTPEAVYPALRAFKGVGHWTAAWAMIRGIGHYAYFGSADVALRSAVNHYFYGKTGHVAPDVMDSLFATYGAYSGLASFYILMRWAFERY